MSRLRTKSQFFSYLDDELQWREKEVRLLGQEVSKATGFWQRTLIRCATALLYAHWEGFVKNGTEALINFVAAQRRPFKELARVYWAIEARKKLRNFGSEPAGERLRSLDSILGMAAVRPRFTGAKSIDTESNLSSKVFRRIAETVGFDTSFYETRSLLIDKSLVDSRNHIAHGECVAPPPEAYLKLQEEVLSMLRAYKSDLQNHVVEDRFLAGTTGEDPKA